jgi:hypothetical protein
MKLVFLAVYRITKHSLAKYPGPLLAALTDWYNIYHCLGGDRHLLFYDLHQKYGNVSIPHISIITIIENIQAR